MIKKQLTGNGGLLASQWHLVDASVYAVPPAYLFDAGCWPQLSGKAGAGRGSAFFVSDDHGDFVLRHYRRGGMVARISDKHYIATGAASSRAFREWRLLAAMVQDGLPVPLPVAARYARRGGLYTASLLTRLIPHTRMLSETLREASMDAQNWHRLGELLQRFHRRGVFHADLNAHNILCDDDGGFHVIDFDRGCLREPGGWCAGNLARLRRSLDKLAAQPAGLQFTEDDWAALTSGYSSSSSASDA